MKKEKERPNHLPHWSHPTSQAQGGHKHKVRGSRLTSQEQASSPIPNLRGIHSSPPSPSPSPSSSPSSLQVAMSSPSLFLVSSPMCRSGAAPLRQATLPPARRLQFFSRSRRRRRPHPPPLLYWATGVGTRMVSSSCFEYKRTSRRNGVYASLFGVGAPEALVIGVVALLVFGPKGLAEVARNLGKTLRAFQPTIRELQDVSREFKSTLEREIGLDEAPPSTNYRPTTMNNSQQPAVDPNGKPETAPYTSEELMKVTEEQLAASAAAAWNTQQPPPSQQQEAASTSQSNEVALSGGNDGPGAATRESNPSHSEKAETER